MYVCCLSSKNVGKVLRSAGECAGESAHDFQLGVGSYVYKSVYQFEITLQEEKRPG